MRSPQNPVYAYKRAFRTEGNIIYLSGRPAPKEPLNQPRPAVEDPSDLSTAIAEREAALAEMRTAGSDFARFSAASKREAELAAWVRQLRRAASPRLSVHPYHETQE